MSESNSEPRSGPPELVERRFRELSRLRFRVHTCGLGGKHHASAIVIAFKGVVGIGSEGNGDADFMCIVTRAALAAWHSHAVVFDLRELDCKWGDSIWRLFGHGINDTGIQDMPTALVVSDLCRSGFATCAGLVPRMFDDVESAIRFVAEPARMQLERLFAELDGRS